jgi:HEAT repeat protein
MAETLLQQASSSERLRGVGYMEKVRAPGRRTIDALLQTLDSDPSVNVRLAAADALYLFAGRPGVKEGVILSLAQQVSPSVQVALIDLLVDMREKRAVEALKILAGNDKLNPDVRRKAELGVRQLI